jgi:hypothetical protein
MLGRVLGEGITPAEYYPFWEHHRKGLSVPYRDLLASDVTERTKRRVRAAVSELTTEQNDRLLLKITGWPRIGFLAEIFEGAKIVHVVRDGRAVINSQLTPTSRTVGAVLRTGVGASYPPPARRSRMDTVNPLRSCCYPVEDLDGCNGVRENLT